MSTLGRKAMRKTLKRLRANANRNLKDYLKALKEIRDTQDAVERQIKERTFMVPAIFLVNSLFDYIAALQDYLSELDEHWDKKEEEEMKKLINLIKETGSKSVKKDEAKKTKYID